MTPNDNYAIEVFFDGGCPLCRREVAFLRRLDRRKAIRWTDIDDPAFQAAEVGKSQEELMARMHGRLPNGEWIQSVEVFRRMYAAVGLGPAVWLTRLPGVSHLLNWGYRVFARNRLRITRRCTASTCARPIMPPTGAVDQDQHVA